jgi:hypothetical protein
MIAIAHRIEVIASEPDPVDCNYPPVPIKPLRNCSDDNGQSTLSLFRGLFSGGSVEDAKQRARCELDARLQAQKDALYVVVVV